MKYNVEWKAPDQGDWLWKKWHLGRYHVIRFPVRNFKTNELLKFWKFTKTIFQWELSKLSLGHSINSISLIFFFSEFLVFDGLSIYFSLATSMIKIALKWHSSVVRLSENLSSLLIRSECIPNIDGRTLDSAHFRRSLQTPRANVKFL